MGEPATPQGVADRSISAAGWMTAGTALRAVLQIAAQIAFARVLGPDNFGIFLLASLAIALSALFADIGMSYALIQKKEVSQRDSRLAFTWHILVAALVTVVLAVAAPLVAAWFNKPEVAPVLMALSLVLLVNAAGIPAMNLLRRDMNFRAIQLALLVSYLVGYILVGIPVLLLGGGIWAPVVAWLTQAALNSLLLYVQKRHPVGLLLRGEDGTWFMGYSATFFTTNITNWSLMNLDRALLGRVADAAAVGFYATPYNLLNNPTLQILNTSQSILFSAASRLQDNRQDMRRAYLAVLAAISVFVFPVFAGISAAATTLVAVLYGPAWAPAADVVRALAWAMPLYLIWAISTPILWNTGQKTLEFKRQLPLVPVWALAAWYSAQQGIEALAWALVAMQAVRAVSTTLPAAGALRIGMRDYLVVLQTGLIISAVVVLVVALTGIVSTGWSLLLTLVSQIGAAAIVWGLALRISAHWLPPELNRLIERTLARLPLRLNRALTLTLFPQMQR